MTRKRRQRFVLDTNVAVSAFLWGGRPATLIELAGEGQIDLFTSSVLLDELAATLAKPKLASRLEERGVPAADLIARYRLLAALVRPRILAVQLSRDADDDHVIACAIAARADAIVSGDDDLLSIKSVSGIAIHTVAGALEGLEPAD